MLSPIVTSYVLNKSCRHWLLVDALQFSITKTLEVCDEVDHAVNHDGMANPEASAFDVELAKLMIHMKWEIMEVLQPFLSFMHAFEKKGKICWHCCSIPGSRVAIGGELPRS
jgi:hypothetical protein